MQKKLTVLFAFAIFVLLVGWAITPVQAHCKGKHFGDHPHCNDEPTPSDPEFVELSMEGDMLTTTLQLDLIHNTSKWLTIGSTNFDGDIRLQFDTTECFQDGGDFGNDPEGPTGLQTLFEEELREAIITSGFLNIGIDRKNVGEGSLGIQYLGDLGMNDGTGDETRINFRGRFGGFTQDMPIEGNPNQRTFMFIGPVFLSQLTAGGAMSSPMLGCNDQTVTFTVDLAPGP